MTEEQTDGAENETLGQLAQLNRETKSKKREVVNEGAELPPGNEVVAAPAASEEGDEETTKAPAEPEELIRIAGREFKSQKEALAYAEKLEQDRIITEAHSAGIREALEAQARGQQPQAQVVAEEDNFDVRFYSDPKGTLRALKEEAKQEAIQSMQAERTKEKLWDEFLDEYPDVRRRDAERVVNENVSLLNGLKEKKDAFRFIATRVRTEYDEIIERTKPKTELTNRKPTQSPSGGSERGVTPARKEEKILSLAEQLRTIRR